MLFSSSFDSYILYVFIIVMLKEVNFLRVLIDGDGCPVVDLTIEFTKKHEIECIVVCDNAHSIYKEGVQTIVVSVGNDSVDYAIVNNLQPADIVITQDYGLAALCLAKQATVISQDGLIFSNDNIEQLLFQRYNSQKLRKSGQRIKGPKKRNKQNDVSFLHALEKVYVSSKGV